MMSVRKMVSASHRVVFAAEGSYGEDVNTGETMRIEDTDGVYVESGYAGWVLPGKVGETCQRKITNM